jgi:hypothetical protein
MKLKKEYKVDEDGYLDAGEWCLPKHYEEDVTEESEDEEE